MDRGWRVVGVAEVEAALGAVEEPALRRSIVELGMVKGVAVDGDTAVVRWPCRSRATSEPRASCTAWSRGAVLEATDADRVDVDLREMTDDGEAGRRPAAQGRSAAEPACGGRRQRRATGRRRAPTRSPTPAPASWRSRRARAESGSRRSPRTSSIALAAAWAPGRRGRRRRVGVLDAPHARDPRSHRA